MGVFVTHRPSRATAAGSLTMTCHHCSRGDSGGMGRWGDLCRRRRPSVMGGTAAAVAVAYAWWATGVAPFTVLSYVVVAVPSVALVVAYGAAGGAGAEPIGRRRVLPPACQERVDHHRTPVAGDPRRRRRAGRHRAPLRGSFAHGSHPEHHRRPLAVRPLGALRAVRGVVVGGLVPGRQPRSTRPHRGGLTCSGLQAGW